MYKALDQGLVTVLNSSNIISDSQKKIKSETEEIKKIIYE